MSDTLTPAERTQAAGEFAEALAVAARPASLRDREEYLALLRDAADDIPAEMEEAYAAEVQLSVKESREKRDAWAVRLDMGLEEIAMLKAKVAAQKQVVQRLESRIESISTRLDRDTHYLLGAIQLYGEWSRTKKYKHLVGETATLKANHVAPSVDIVDAAAIPLEYQGIELKLSASQYAFLRTLMTAGLRPDFEFMLREAIGQGTLVPSKALIAQTLKHPCPQCGDAVHEACAVCGGTGFERVPGCRLLTDRFRLVVS